MSLTHEGYSAGHPWYYVTGGRRLSIKEIQASVIASGYRGYMAHDIDKADQLNEPKRSGKLRSIRKEAKEALIFDISRYREVARDLVRRRGAGLDDVDELECADVHMSMSLKHNHIYNQLAHLLVIDELLSQQGDLFGF